MYLDRKARELVVRIAYAGQPLSGKTQSLRTLVPLLKGAAARGAVLSPEESQGRTVYFDWASYVGGSIQGNRLRCQIVTVPGQAAFVRRRRLLVESADVVVFVVDSDRGRLEEGGASYREMLPWLERTGGSPIPVIFQCNKRDLPTAATLDLIRAELGLPVDCTMFESTATSGRGIRSAFVAALRVAGARVVDSREGRLTGSTPEVVSGEQLLAVMRRLESDEPEAAPKLDGAARDTGEAPNAKNGTEGRDPGQRESAARRWGPPTLVSRGGAVAEAPVQPGSGVTRRWSGEGPRPAVMPAADWRRLVGMPAQAREAEPEVSPVSAAAAVSAPLPDDATVRPDPNAATLVRDPEGSTVAAVSGDRSSRPAVMPSAAWLANRRVRDNAVVGEPAPVADVGAPREPVPVLAALPAADLVETSVISDEESVLLPGPDQSLEDVWPLEVWASLRPLLAARPRNALSQRGVWAGEVAPQWTAGSEAIFGDYETGREALGLEIRRREQLRPSLWPHRCLVLCADGTGYWRLWEVVRSAVSLAQIFQGTLAQAEQGHTQKAAWNLLKVAVAYIAFVESQTSRPEPLEAGFKLLGPHEGRLVYTGFLPAEGTGSHQRPAESVGGLEAQLRAHLPGRLGPAVDVSSLCRELEAVKQTSAHKQIVDLLCSVLREHQ